MKRAAFRSSAEVASSTARHWATACEGMLTRPLSTQANLWVGGESVSSSTSKWIDVKDPATQEIVNRVPETTPAEFQAAVEAATEAFPSWAATPVAQRQRVMVKLAELIRAHTDAIAQSITAEQGKTLKDARGDVFRGLEVCSNNVMALGPPHKQK
jgi:malonate-semialdehyde dehydrogenase (acetylating) / methylmalonate-semialdehyde dehydrogenase